MFGKRKRNVSKEINNILDQLDRSREINQTLANQTQVFINSASDFRKQYNEYLLANACNVY